MGYDSLDLEYLDLPLKLSNGIFNIGGLLFIVFLFTYVLQIISYLINRIRYKECRNYGSQNILELNPFKFYYNLLENDHNYRNEKDSKLIRIGITTWAFIGLFVWIGYFGARYNLFGSTEMGHYFEKYSYEKEYYVYLYPINNRGTEEEFKSRANILKIDEDYLIEKAYHPDGYILDFIGDSVMLDEMYICEDQFGNNWGVTLTNEVVE